MEGFFLLIYNFFKNRKILFYSLVMVSGVSLALLASKIKLEEDISKSVSLENDKASIILNQSSITNKIILNIFLQDTLKPGGPEKLIAYADELCDSLQNKDYRKFIRQTTFKINDDYMEGVMNFFYENLPIFITENDYHKIDSLLLPETIDRSLEKNYNALISPASFAMKKYILTDPVGINGLALEKLKQFQLADGYEIIDGYIFSGNKKNLFIFLDPVNYPSETLQNSIFFRNLDKLLKFLSAKEEFTVKTEYYGAAAVAVGNAQQVKKDIGLTVTLAIILILLFVGWYFRKASIPFISFLPGVFGGVLSLALIYIIKGKISTIALGIGSVLLGIIVDYALYIYSIYKEKRSVEIVIRDMTIPIMTCSLTTAIAFFSLLLVKSEVLRDLGLFAGMSILGAALFSLVILPHLVKFKIEGAEKKNKTIVDKISDYPFELNHFLIFIILIVSVIFLFFYRNAAFETDMYSMNYLSPKMKEAEKNLKVINDISLKSVYIFSTGKNLSQALTTNARVSASLEQLKTGDIVKSYTNVGSILINDSIQKKRIQRWKEYWTPRKITEIRNSILSSGERFGFRKDAFNQFYSFLAGDFQPVDISKFDTLRDLFLNDMISETGDMSMVMSLIKVNDENRHTIYSEFLNENDVIVIDRQEITSDFVTGIKHDFDLLVNLCLIFVTLTLIITFGRLETGLMASAPMFLGWLWTLGFMGMFGLKFNIFNIIVSTFVFGLGVDYSVLMVRGLMLEYKYGHKELSSYKTSVFLSSFTTIIGVGVLLLAKHPSLNSIALISIIGLFSVVLISYTFQPILFSWLVSKNGKRRVIPVTLTDIILTVFVLTGAIVLSVVLNLILFLVVPLPVPTRTKKKFLHNVLCTSLKISSYLLIPIKQKTINESGEDFSKPSMIIANHQSHMDLALLMMQSPKFIILTTKWVWNNPAYFLFIRYLDFYPVTHGYEPLIDKLKKKVDEGYSILVFPEGTRSPDQKIHRFHKGAFLLAEKLNLDIVPIIVHGAADCMNKGENHLKRGSVTIKIYPRVKAEDRSIGNDYHERTKTLLRFFRDEYQKVKTELETPDYFRRKLVRNFIYKGPVLEWYTRIKLSLENNYDYINDVVPRQGNIVDIGCGYGLISYLLNFTSENRRILGIDYDTDKIELANNCLSKNDRISFVSADAATYEYPKADVFLMSDVLHYMPGDKQEQLLSSCSKQLNPGGIIIIRDADKDLEKRHFWTRYTEFFSTRSGFNKSLNKKLFFFSGNKINDFAGRNGLTIEVSESSKVTSNRLYILRSKI
ncbi:MAG: 1-acyl-sn-glycerol-3-phosphate acyltransferase [Bacteroidia bacterium]|nr:1-acyl-sn-glycerol-3-phosphate acyltransferase [Bacteroidia bacterium]